MIRLTKNKFLSNVFILLSGSIVAQLIPILTSPILTRIYSPYEFGIFAFFVSCVTLLSILATGSYELAIMLPKKEADSIHVRYIAITFTVLSTSLLFISVTIFSEKIIGWMNINVNREFLYFIVLSIFIIGLYQSTIFWLNRNKLYKTMSLTGIYQSSSATIVQICAGLLNITTYGLILGRIAGQLIALIYLLKSYKKFRFLSRLTYQRIKYLALIRRYKKFPLFEMWSKFFEILSNEIPIILITYMFTATITGYYILANRVLLLPMIVLGLSISQVFFQEAVTIKNDFFELKKFVIKVLNKLLLISVIPTGFIVVFGEEVFQFLLGNNWILTGQISEILVFLAFFSFITSHLTNMYIVLEEQKISFIFNLILFTGKVISIALGNVVFGDIFSIIVLFTFISVFIKAFWCWFILKKLKIESYQIFFSIIKYLSLSIGFFLLIEFIFLRN